VIGHLGYQIAQQLGNGKSLGVSIRYVEQTQALGIANALGQLEPYINSPMFLLLGDIFFVADNLDDMVQTLRRKQAKAVLACKREEDPDAMRRNFAIIERDDGTVSRVVEKPRHSTTTRKGCGLYLFDLEVFDAIRRTPRTAMRDEYEITDSIQIMVDDGHPIYASEVVSWDINLTCPHDVLDCNLFQLERLGQDKLVGDEVNIHPDAVLKNVVIGNGVTIEHPIALRDSVVFANTKVTSRQDLRRQIVTSDQRIDCR